MIGKSKSSSENSRIEIQPLFELLLYFGGGKRQQFDNIVLKWIKYSKLDSLFLDIHHKIASSLRRELSSIGLLELYTKDDNECWLFIGNCLIYSSYRNSYMLIAPELTIQRQKKSEDLLKYKIIDLWFKGFPELHLDAYFYNLPKLDSIEVIKPNIELIADFLPKMSSVIQDSCEIKDIPNQGVQHYDFSKHVWDFDVESTSNSGLYRYRQYPWDTPRYFIRTDRHDVPNLEINNTQDWVFLVSRYYLGYEISIEVDIQKRSSNIILDSKIYKELPLLLKRALLSRMLTSPLYTDGYLHIFDVSLTLLEKIEEGDLPIKMRFTNGK